MAGADFTERLANAVGGTAKTYTAYGEPVERDGVAVIPVVRFFPFSQPFALSLPGPPTHLSRPFPPTALSSATVRVGDLGAVR
jgi:hypothetical protein